MLNDFKKELTSFKLLVILLIIAVSIYLLQIAWQILGNFSDIFVIVIIAWLLSFIIEPIVGALSKFLKVPKVLSALLVYIFFLALFSIAIFILLPLVIKEFQTLSVLAPRYLASYPSFIQRWNLIITGSLDNFVSYVPSVANVFLDIVLILILSFYFVIDKERINEELYKLAPKTWNENLRFIQKTVDDAFSSYLRIQVIFAVFAAVATWIVMTLFGVSFAASISLFSGVLTLIPLIGPVLALLPPAFVVLITNPYNPAQAIIILLILLIIQQLIFNALGPKLMGSAFKLHPIVVFLSILVGFRIAGPLGAIFVVPVLGIIVIVLKRLGYYFINPTKSS